MRTRRLRRWRGRGRRNILPPVRVVGGMHCGREQAVSVCVVDVVLLDGG
jgi:hypothetical protein